MSNAASALPAGPGGQRGPSPLLPPDFEAWPKPARWFLRTLVSLPTWQEHGFALCTDEQLAEWRQSDPRTIRRMRIEATKRLEVSRVFVKRGEALPDGERVRRSLWILVAGDARRARLAELDQVEVLVDLAEEAASAFVRPSRSDCPRQPDTLSPDRSVDPLHETKLKPLSPPELPTPPPREDPRAERSTSFHSEGSTEDNASDERAAHTIATHYARATAKKWRSIHADVLAFVLRFVREMNGIEADKVERACRVIDRVAGDASRSGQSHPTLRYVFHEQIFWKRLEGLARSPSSVPVGRPAVESVDAARRPRTKAMDARERLEHELAEKRDRDFARRRTEQLARVQRLARINDEQVAPPAAPTSSPRTTAIASALFDAHPPLASTTEREEIRLAREELAALVRADEEAHARLGLLPLMRASAASHHLVEASSAR